MTPVIMDTSEIAPKGQPATQAPQLMHLSGSMVAMSLSSMLMALTGQLRLQGRSISTMAL